MNNKYTLLGVFAHPDDETFGPGATLATYAHAGHAVHLLTATRGQAGQTSNHKIEKELGHHRENELKKATGILGISHVHVLDFFDGSLNEHQLPLLKSHIEHEVKKIRPSVIITYEPLGISGHLDHIAVSKAVTQLFDEDKLSGVKKVYYFGISDEAARLIGRKGGLDETRLAKIDIEKYTEIKITAMKAHHSQEKDWKRLLKRVDFYRSKNSPVWKYDCFELARTTLKNVQFPETDLFAGI